MTQRQHIEIVERLGLQQQFRLIEIAHETNDHEIRKAALIVLHRYLNPLVTIVDGELTTEKDNG